MRFKLGKNMKKVFLSILVFFLNFRTGDRVVASSSTHSREVVPPALHNSISLEGRKIEIFTECRRMRERRKFSPWWKLMMNNLFRQSTDYWFLGANRFLLCVRFIRFRHHSVEISRMSWWLEEFALSNLELQSEVDGRQTIYRRILLPIICSLMKN